MPDYSYDMMTPLLVVWSMGSAQITYAVVGPATLGVGLHRMAKRLAGSERRSLRECWVPFAVSTLCLCPFVGGVLAAEYESNTKRF